MTTMAERHAAEIQHLLDWHHAKIKPLLGDRRNNGKVAALRASLTKGITDAVARHRVEANAPPPLPPDPEPAQEPEEPVETAPEGAAEAGEEKSPEPAGTFIGSARTEDIARP